MPKKCPICHEKEIATCVYENPPLSESLQEKIKNGEIVLKDTPMTKDDPAYMCRECGFEFYMSL
jgi:rubrerythrin